MIVGVPKEIKNNEFRVAITPAGVREFIKSGEIGSNSPHVDFSDEHKTMLYYVNDSDGDTIFYNENYKTIKNSKSFSVDQKVNPVMGRAVLFDGLKFHSSSPPFLNDRRVVININYL